MTRHATISAMQTSRPQLDRCHRREAPRVGSQALCWEIVNGYEASALAVNLSPAGLRIERPYVGGITRNEIALQLELPEVDEIMWARGHACFDVLIPDSGPAGGPLGLIRRTGYRVIAAARRDLKLLEEYVVETYRVRCESVIDAAIASCYRPDLTLA